MFDSVREVVMLPSNGLEQIIDEVNFKYNQREGDPEWFDPEEFMYLFWCEQEFGVAFRFLRFGEEPRVAAL